tara:strand:+ start:6734 stop:7504 length:771 start_codon:yes stop_codon:yes gene_type:complete
MGQNKKSKFLAFSCVHVPFHPEDIIKSLQEVIVKEKPTHVICLGDLFDATAVSVHPDEASHTLEEEYYQGAKFLEQVESVCSEHCKLIWMHGNHDDNILYPDPRRTDHRLRSLLDWNRHSQLGKTFRRWRQFPYINSEKGIYRLGPVLFAHGFKAGGNSDEIEAIHFNNLMGGHAHRLIVRGHTHRPVPPTQCMKARGVSLPLWYANAGTLGPLKPVYMRRKDSSNWGHGVVVGECNTGDVRRPSKKDWDSQLITL